MARLIDADTLLETSDVFILHTKEYVVSNDFLCSKCGHREVSYYPINPRPGGCCIADENGNFYYPPKLNYCPNCGVKMDGGTD